MPLEAVKSGVSFFGADLTVHARLKQDAPATSSVATATAVVVAAIVATATAAVAASTSAVPATIAAPSSGRQIRRRLVPAAATIATVLFCFYLVIIVQSLTN